MFTLAIFYCHKKETGIVWTWSKSNHNRFYIKNYFRRSWYFLQKYFYPFTFHILKDILFLEILMRYGGNIICSCATTLNWKLNQIKVFSTQLFQKDAPKLISLSKSEVWSKRKTEWRIQKGDFIVNLWVVSWKTFKLKRIVGSETTKL